jgi:hypothetical protein
LATFLASRLCAKPLYGTVASTNYKSNFGGPIMKKLYLLFIPLIFVGCSSSMYFTEQESPIVKNDSYSEQTQIIGISKRSKADGGGIGGTSINYFLRSFINKNDTTTLHQIYIESVYVGNDWNFYQRASLEGGKNLELLEIGRDVSCSSYVCTYEETVAVTIPEDILEESTSGLSLKVYAQSGNEFVVDLTPKQISAQLQEIN